SGSARRCGGACPRAQIQTVAAEDAATACLPDDLAENPCTTRAQDTSSQRDERVCPFNKSRARSSRSIRFRGISLGARAECFTAIAPARPQGCESRRAQLRSDNDCVRQLQSRCSCAARSEEHTSELQSPYD